MERHKELHIKKETKRRSYVQGTGGGLPPKIAFSMFEEEVLKLLTPEAAGLENIPEGGINVEKNLSTNNSILESGLQIVENIEDIEIAEQVMHDMITEANKNREDTIENIPLYDNIEKRRKVDTNTKINNTKRGNLCNENNLIFIYIYIVLIYTYMSHLTIKYNLLIFFIKIFFTYRYKNINCD